MGRRHARLWRGDALGSGGLGGDTYLQGNSERRLVRLPVEPGTPLDLSVAQSEANTADTAQLPAQDLCWKLCPHGAAAVRLAALVAHHADLRQLVRAATADAAVHNLGRRHVVGHGGHCCASDAAAEGGPEDRGPGVVNDVVCMQHGRRDDAGNNLYGP